MLHVKTIGPVALIASLAIAAPASAAEPTIGLSQSELSGVPSAVAGKLKRAERALSRAETSIDVGRRARPCRSSRQAAARSAWLRGPSSCA